MRPALLAPFALLLATRTASAAGAADLLGWLPADTVTITGAPGARAPLLSWLSSNFQMLEKTPPACWTKLMGDVEASLQLWRAPPESSEALLIKGGFSRDAAERCLSQAFRLLEASTKLTRRGALTRMESTKLGQAWLGWSKEWVVWSGRQERVEQLLAALAKKAATPPPIAGPLARVDLGTPLWMVSIIDYTGRMLGVPSRSLVGWLAPGASGMEMPVALEFGSEAEAERALTALGKLGKDTTLPAPLRSAVGQLKASRRKHFLTLDLDPTVWMKPETMGALQTVIGRK
jgi:hypothetical protein